MKNITCKTQYILFTFFIITIILLINVSTYSYLIKYRVKQKHQTKNMTQNKNNSMKIVQIENNCYRYKHKKPHMTFLILSIQKNLTQIIIK